MNILKTIKKWVGCSKKTKPTCDPYSGANTYYYTVYNMTDPDGFFEKIQADSPEEADEKMKILYYDAQAILRSY